MRRRGLILLVCLGIFILGALIFWSAARSAKPAFLNTSAPAFDTLRHAVQRLGDARSNLATNELPASVQSNAAALATTREALTQPFEAPPTAYESPAMGGTVLNDLGSLKLLALALKNEGAYFESRNETVKAAESYADIIRLGVHIESGPFLFAMVGISIERLGIEALQKIAPSLSVAARSQLAATLREINSHRVPFGSIEERERHLRRRHSPTPLHYLIFSRQLRAARDSTQNKYETTWQAVDALASKLALPHPAPAHDEEQVL